MGKIEIEMREIGLPRLRPGFWREAKIRENGILVASVATNINTSYDEEALVNCEPTRFAEIVSLLRSDWGVSDWEQGEPFPTPEWESPNWTTG